MEVLEGEALYRTLLDRYSKNPSGWSFTVSPSRSGFFDARLGGPEESWHLKLDTIYKPSPFVLGARTDPNPAWPSSPISFGFRRFDAQEAPTLLDESPEGMRRLLAFLGATSPVVPSSPGGYIQGPYLYTSRPQPAASSMTREERTVDARLSAEMQSLVRRRYPSYF